MLPKVFFSSISFYPRRYNEWGRACWELQHWNLNGKGRGVSSKLDWRFFACASEDDIAIVEAAECEKWMAGHILTVESLGKEWKFNQYDSFRSKSEVVVCPPFIGHTELTGRSFGTLAAKQVLQIVPPPLLKNRSQRWRCWRLMMANWCCLACFSRGLHAAFSTLWVRCQHLFDAGGCWKAAKFLEVFFGCKGSWDWESGREIQLWTITFRVPDVSAASTEKT